MAKAPLFMDYSRFGMFGWNEKNVRDFILGVSEADRVCLNAIVSASFQYVDSKSLERELDGLKKDAGRLLIAVRDLNPVTFRRDRADFITTVNSRFPNNQIRLVYAQDTHETSPHLPIMPNFMPCFEREDKAVIDTLEQTEYFIVPSAFIWAEYSREFDKTIKRDALDLLCRFTDPLGTTFPRPFEKYFNQPKK